MAVNKAIVDIAVKVGTVILESAAEAVLDKAKSGKSNSRSRSRKSRSGKNYSKKRR